MHARCGHRGHATGAPLPQTSRCAVALFFHLRSLDALQCSTPPLSHTSTAGRNQLRAYGGLSLGMDPACHRTKTIGRYLCAFSTAVLSASTVPPLTPPSRPPACQVSTADSSPKPNVGTRDQEPFHSPYEGLEFARLVGFLGEEECSLDALLESEPEQSTGEQELVEQEEAWRLLCSWCVRAKSQHWFAASHPPFFCYVF